jgi:hypothetical protein
VAQFDDYPILWLGPEYDVDEDGQPDPITYARAAESPAFTHPVTGQTLVPARRSYSISYGTCDIPKGAEGCRIPLTLMFRAPCETRPLSDAVRSGTEVVRGVEAIVETSGYLRFETADFTLTIAAPAGRDGDVLRNAKRIAADLQPANAKANAIMSPDGQFRPKGELRCDGAGATTDPGAPNGGGVR